METALKSGIPVYQTPYTSDQLLAKFCSGKLANPPGKVFDYNNGDYIVLGKIIERLYGQTYEQVLRDRILRPLKLENTGLLRQSDIVEGLADTYFFRGDLKSLVNDLPSTRKTGMPRARCIQRWTTSWRFQMPCSEPSS